MAITSLSAEALARAREVLAEAIDRQLAAAPEAAAQFQQHFGASQESATQWLSYAVTQQAAQVAAVVQSPADGAAPPTAPPAPGGESSAPAPTDSAWTDAPPTAPPAPGGEPSAPAPTDSAWTDAPPTAPPAPGGEPSAPAPTDSASTDAPPTAPPAPDELSGANTTSTSEEPAPEPAPAPELPADITPEEQTLVEEVLNDEIAPVLEELLAEPGDIDLEGLTPEDLEEALREALEEIGQAEPAATEGATT